MKADIVEKDKELGKKDKEISRLKGAAPNCHCHG